MGLQAMYPSSYIIYLLVTRRFDTTHHGANCTSVGYEIALRTFFSSKNGVKLSAKYVGWFISISLLRIAIEWEIVSLELSRNNMEMSNVLISLNLFINTKHTFEAATLIYPNQSQLTKKCIGAAAWVVNQYHSRVLVK